MKHIKEYDEYLNEQKYKLGDKWSNDFDYVGMLEMGAKAKASMGVKKLQSLFDSFEDVNYHSEASPLSYAIDELKDGNKAEANRLMKEFNKNCEDTLKTYESFINEANIPSNIRKFAKERGVLRDVQQIARWAEKAGERIVGGTAIGRGYDTLVLDLTYDGSEIYFDTDEGTIEVNGQPVDSWESFSKAVEESVTEAKMSKEKIEDMIWSLENEVKSWHPSNDSKKKAMLDKLRKKLSKFESVVTEAEMTKKTFLDLWKETYGENFIKEYPAVAKILKNRPNNIDKREIARIWDETYGEDFKEEYPGIWDKLD